MIQKLFDFIESCPTACHTAATVGRMLEEAGFTQLQETEPWALEPGRGYFTTRGMSALIAFRVPKKDFRAFSIVAPHGDSPSFKVKESPELRGEGFTRLNTEVYGGALPKRWVDRPLSVAGRLALRTATGVEAKLVDIPRDLLIIPGLAPHLDRELANQSAAPDLQKETLPLLGAEDADLLELLARSVGAEKKDVLSHDLYLYVRQRGAVLGTGEELIAAPRLDDLECVFSAVTAFLQSENPENATVCAIFDNEETGSLTRQGADSTLLADVLSRVCQAMGKGEEEKLRAIQGGFLLSADNAHGAHPNYPEKSDPTNRCRLNGGVVVKHSTRYASDAVTAAVFQRVCERAGVPTQAYYNNSKLAGGSTLGNISGSHVSIPTVDIGLAQLSMHSPVETAGARDLGYMVAAMAAFYRSAVTREGDGSYTIA